MKKEYLSAITSLTGFIITILKLASNFVYSQTGVKNILLLYGAFSDGPGCEGVYNILKKRATM